MENICYDVVQVSCFVRLTKAENQNMMYDIMLRQLKSYWCRPTAHKVEAMFTVLVLVNSRLVITRQVPVQRAVERDEIPYP